jgi:trehalose 6-phosphate synthase/phosphatase
LDTDKTHPVDSDAPSYFANIPGAKTESMEPTNLPSSGSQTRRKTSAGEDLLRRLSLTGPTSPMSPGIDPREEHPGLRLSGRVISAAFCIPYKLYFKAGSDWVCIGLFLHCKSGPITDSLCGVTDRETPVWHFGLIRLVCSSGIR